MTHLLSSDVGAAAAAAASTAPPMSSSAPEPRRTTLDPRAAREQDAAEAVQGSREHGWRPLMQRLLVHVRRQLRGPLRRKLESMDIVQEVALDLQRESTELLGRRGSNLDAWLRSVVHHKICNLDDHHRAAKRTASREETLAAETPCAPAESAPVETLIAQEEIERLRMCLEAVPDPQRTLIELRDLEGLGFDEIARRTGRPSADAARMAYGRALALVAGRMTGRRP